MTSGPGTAVSRDVETLDLQLRGHTDMNGHSDAMQPVLRARALYGGVVPGRSATGPAGAPSLAAHHPPCRILSLAHTHALKTQVILDLIIPKVERHRAEPCHAPSRTAIPLCGTSWPAEPRSPFSHVTCDPGRPWGRCKRGGLAYPAATREGSTRQILFTADVSDRTALRRRPIADSGLVGRTWEDLFSQDILGGFAARNPVVDRDQPAPGFWGVDLVSLNASDPTHRRSAVIPLVLGHRKATACRPYPASPARVHYHHHLGHLLRLSAGAKAHSVRGSPRNPPSEEAFMCSSTPGWAGWFVSAAGSERAGPLRPQGTCRPLAQDELGSSDRERAGPHQRAALCRSAHPAIGGYGAERSGLRTRRAGAEES